MKETILKIKGKVVGKIAGDEYITTRDKSKHYMFKYEGYGINQKILNFLKSREVKKIRIKVGSEVFLFSLNDYLKSTNTYDNDGDYQRFVSINETFKNIKLNNYIK